MKAMRGAHAYAKVGVESRVMSASPHQLITLLFEGVENAIRTAHLQMEAGNIADRGKSISKAIEIVQGGLLAALDREAGSQVVENLAALYQFVIRLLMEANRENNPDKLTKASAVLEPISSAWRAVGTGSS
jgi:flagellar secretion chaperone FliS